MDKVELIRKVCPRKKLCEVMIPCKLPPSPPRCVLRTHREPRTSAGCGQSSGGRGPGKTRRGAAPYCSV